MMPDLTPSPALLEIEQVSKSFDATPVLRDVTCQVAAGEIACLLGPSGCGKTTLLRIVAGLERADAGRVRFAGQDLAAVPVHRRGFGLMFQDFALFPHRTVADNVAFGLRMAGVDRAARTARVAEMLELVGLSGYGSRGVHQLSGGQQQRVALARSLAPRPMLLLLDEPLGSLDRTLREELMGELRHILKHPASGQPAGRSMTALYVTHDQQEAFAIADRVIVMNAGRIEQIGSPQAVYHTPANAFVARFLGMQNLLPAQVQSTAPELRLATPLGSLVCTRCTSDLAEGASVNLLIRPDAAHLAAAAPAAASPVSNLIHGQLLDLSFRGSQARVTVGYGVDGRLVFDLPGGAASALPAAGQPVTLLLDPDGLSVLPLELSSSDKEHTF